MKIKLVFYVGFVALLGSKFGESRGCFEIGEVIIINYLGGRDHTLLLISRHLLGEPHRINHW